MTTFHCLSVGAPGPLPPNSKRSAVSCVESVERSTLCPEMQHRALDFPGVFFVRAVVFYIDRGGGPIFLTDAVHAGRVAIS